MDVEQDEEELGFLQDDLDQFDTLIDNMIRYTKSVFLDEQKNSDLSGMRASFNSTKEYQEEFERLEKNRKTNHDMLISSVSICDKLCMLYGEEPIYGEMKAEFAQDVSTLKGKENYNKPGVKEERRKLAEWSFDFVISNTVALALYGNPDLSEQDLKNYQKDPESFAHIAKAVQGQNLDQTMRKVIDMHDKYSR